MNARRSLLVLLVLAALGVGALPTMAETTLPAYCGKKTLVLAEGESLVEKTVYMHGRLPLGDVDVQQNRDLLSLDATAPTGPASKVKQNNAAVANPASNKNSLIGAWTLKMAQPERIVCATTTFYAADSSDFSLQLFIDQPQGLQSVVAATGTAAGSGDNVRTYTGSFGTKLDKVATSEVTLQIAAATAAPVLYDSTSHPGRLTYLTVVGP